MAQVKPQSPVVDGLDDDDWEVVDSSRPDDVLSTLSDCETIGNDCDYVPVDNPKQTAYQDRIYRNPRLDATGPIPTLRRSLYALKDALAASVAQLTQFNRFHASSDAALTMSKPILRVQRTQLAALQVLLTNISRDWEQSASSGGMTFDEFAELNAVGVDELAKIMNEFAVVVHARRYRRKPQFRRLGLEDGEAQDEKWGRGLQFLQVILPAVDQINTLLRIPEADLQMAQEETDDEESEDESREDDMNNDGGTVDTKNPHDDMEQVEKKGDSGPEWI